MESDAVYRSELTGGVTHGAVMRRWRCHSAPVTADTLGERSTGMVSQLASLFSNAFFLAYTSLMTARSAT